jgi:hypothetical protein
MFFDYFCIISKRDGNFNWIRLDRDELVACVPLNHPSVERGYIENEEFCLLHQSLEETSKFLNAYCKAIVNNQAMKEDWI